MCKRSVGTALSPQDITVDSIHNPQLFKIHLKTSKTDPFREGSDIWLVQSHDNLCPVSAVLG